jgi:O-antigen/teichoic acid export membrane protein
VIASRANSPTRGPTEPPAERPPPSPTGGRPSGFLFQSSPLGQALGTYLPTTILIRLINFARVLLLTWWMTQQQFGLLAMILFTINVMIPLSSLGLNEAVARYVPQHEAKGSLRFFTWRSANLVAAVTIISVLAMVFLAKPLGVFFYAQVFADPKTFAAFSTDAAELAQLSAVVIALLVAYFYLLAVFKGLRMFAALSLIELANSLLFLAGSVAAKLTGHLSAYTMTAVYGISLAIPVAFFGLAFNRVLGAWPSQHQPIRNGNLAATLLKFSVWTTLAGVTWQVLVVYPAWFLNKVHGNEAVAIFSAVRQIGQFVLLGAVAVSTVIMGTVTATWEQRGRDAARRQLSLAFRGTGLGLLFVCAAIALPKEWLIRLFSPLYEPGAPILPLQLLFFLIGSFLAFLPIHFHLIERTRHMFWPWAVGVAANVLYAFWLAGSGPGVIRESAAWKAITPITSAFFAVGFSDPRGLNSAAWCGVFAIATALFWCIVLIRAECCKLDRGTYIVIGSSLLLAARPWILAAGVVILLIVALSTDWVFSKDERRRVFQYVFGALGHVPVVHFLRNRWHGPR